MSRRRRRVLSVGLLVLAALAPALEGLAQVGYHGWRCVEDPSRTGFGSEIYGIGSRAQAAVQYRLFVNRFDAACRTDVQGLVTFRGEGEAAVIDAMLQRTTDALGRPYTFYALDRALTSAEKTRIESDAVAGLFRVSPVVQVPLWIEGIAVAYNLACTTEPLNLSSPALGAIFGGVATRWNDPLIVAQNPALEDCDQAIRVAVRSDASAQTLTFKDYLSKRNPSWDAFERQEANRQWPPALLDPCRGRGDPGMVACVAGQPGSIGYVGFAQAFLNGLATARVENRSGFVAPSYAECTRAAEIPAYPPRADLDWSQVSLTDPAAGYPICSLAYALAFEKMNPAYGGRITTAEVRSVKDFIWTAVRPETQRRLTRYGIAPLPALLRLIAEQGADSISYFE